jgi:hypothetical protein
MHNLNAVGGHRQMQSSRTWTTSSGDVGLMSDADELEDRVLFVQEYNRLAKKVSNCPQVLSSRIRGGSR